MDSSNKSDNDSHVEQAEQIEERILKFNGEEIVKKYVKGKFLGRGGFAKCYEFRCVNNKKLYAAKIVSKNNLSKQSAKSKLKSEIKIHKSLFHSHIVKFEHVFEDSQNVYILLEICKNQTLNELIKKRKVLTEIEVKYFLDQILKAVKFMHRNKIIHRDLKLGNLFLNGNMEIKIGDFGLASQITIEGERKHTICGTPNYIAPEILDNKSGGHSYEVDFWAIGVIVYTLLLGRPPFETDDVKETYKRIQNNIYLFPQHVYISQHARDLIKRILIINPKDRLDLDGMRSHPFLTTNPIPKSLPQNTFESPPNFQFFRQFLSQTKNITNVNDLSSMNDSQSYNVYLSELREFAMKNVTQFKNNLVNEKVGGQFKILNFSLKKEQHNLLNKKKEPIKLKDINYVTNIVDYSAEFGYLFMFNNFLIEVAFNDKSVIHKVIKQEEFYYRAHKTKIKHNHYNLKDVPTEVRKKVNILINYEKYLIKEDKLNCNTNNIEQVYVKKIIVTEVTYILKLSNNVIQLIFKDTSTLIIDHHEKRNVIFIDKNKKIYNYDIHLVNKTNNKKFLKRYEYYKKFFYEKMEERLANKQKKKKHEENHNDRINLFISCEKRVELNKTM